MAFSLVMLGAYAFEWFAFLFLLALSMFRLGRRLSSRSEILVLTCLMILAAVSWIITNHPSGPDIGFYVKSLVGFVTAPLSFYPDFAPYTYPPLQLYFSSIPYLLTLSPFYSLWLVSIVANLASGFILYLVLGRGLKGLIGAGLLLFIHTMRNIR